MHTPGQKWVTNHEITFVDSVIPAGETVQGVHAREVAKLPHNVRTGFKKMSAVAPKGQTLIAILWDGKVRWLLSPQDAILHMAPRPGTLRRRVSRGAGGSDATDDRAARKPQPDGPANRGVLARRVPRER